MNNIPEVVTIGETMVVFDGVRAGPLRYIETYERHTGGAETNVAVGLVRLGHTSGWISRVGDDEFGHHILSFFRGEKVDMSRVIIDQDHSTGVFFRQRWEHGDIQNFYYRRGSAASFLSPEDLDEEYIAQAKYLHVTGITPALSTSCCETIETAMRIAKERGGKVSLDPNIRLKLWSKEEAVETMLNLLKYADIALPGIEECELLFGTSDPRKSFEQLENLGVSTSVIKLGEKGAIAKQNEEIVEVPGFKIANVIDPFAAGDAFAAGFLAGQLKGWNLHDSLQLANANGAMTVRVKGNVEAFPTLDQVDRFIRGQKELSR